MSTRSTIGYEGDYHLYVEWHDDTLSLHGPSDDILTIMPREVWEKIRLQIISHWLCEVQNGYATLNNVWDNEGSLKRNKILENLDSLLKTITK